MPRFLENLYIESFCEGFIMSGLEKFVEILEEKTLSKEEKEKIKKVFNLLYEDFPDEFYKDLKTLNSIKTKKDKEKKERDLYKKNLEYLVKTKGYEIALENAKINAKKKEMQEILENDIYYEIENLCKEKLKEKGNMKIALSKQREVRNIIEYTRDKIVLANFLLKNKNIKTLDIKNKKSNLSLIINNINLETKEENIYKFGKVYLLIKSLEDYEIIRIEKVDTSKPWFIKNIYNRETIIYVEADEFNRLNI